MKLLNKKIPYTLKRIVPMAMLAGATMFGAGCDNNEPIQKQNIELKFGEINADHITTDTILHYLSMKHIDTIYLVPASSFMRFDKDYGYHYVKMWRDDLLEPRTNLSPRVRGKGDLQFRLGYPSQVPQDSLWFVSKGWTVNKAYWDQEKLFGR